MITEEQKQKIIELAMQKRQKKHENKTLKDRQERELFFYDNYLSDDFDLIQKDKKIKDYTEQ